MPPAGGKGTPLGAEKKFPLCTHDVARVHHGHAEGREIDRPVLVVRGGDQEEVEVL